MCQSPCKLLKFPRVLGSPIKGYLEYRNAIQFFIGTVRLLTYSIIGPKLVKPKMAQSSSSTVQSRMPQNGGSASNPPSASGAAFCQASGTEASLAGPDFQPQTQGQRRSATAQRDGPPSCDNHGGQTTGPEPRQHDEVTSPRSPTTTLPEELPRMEIDEGQVDFGTLQEDTYAKVVKGNLPTAALHIPNRPLSEAEAALLSTIDGVELIQPTGETGHVDMGNSTARDEVQYVATVNQAGFCNPLTVSWADVPVDNQLAQVAHVAQPAPGVQPAPMAPSAQPATPMPRETWQLRAQLYPPSAICPKLRAKLAQTTTTPTTRAPKMTPRATPRRRLMDSFTRTANSAAVPSVEQAVPATRPRGIHTQGMNLMNNATIPEMNPEVPPPGFTARAAVEASREGVMTPVQPMDLSIASPTGAVASSPPTGDIVGTPATTSAFRRPWDIPPPIKVTPQIQLEGDWVMETAAPGTGGQVLLSELEAKTGEPARGENVRIKRGYTIDPVKRSYRQIVRGNMAKGLDLHTLLYGTEHRYTNRQPTSLVFGGAPALVNSPLYWLSQPLNPAEVSLKLYEQKFREFYAGIVLEKLFMSNRDVASTTMCKNIVEIVHKNLQASIGIERGQLEAQAIAHLNANSVCPPELLRAKAHLDSVQKDSTLLYKAMKAIMNH